MTYEQMQETVEQLGVLYQRYESVNKAILMFTDPTPAGWKRPEGVAKGDARFSEAYISYREDNLYLRNMPEGFKDILVMALRESARQIKVKIDEMEAA